MTLLFISLGVYLLSRLFSPRTEEHQREILIGIFISEYHKRSGIWVTREQAIALIQIAYATLTNEERAVSHAEQQRHAQTLARELCQAAEQAVLNNQNKENL